MQTSALSRIPGHRIAPAEAVALLAVRGLRLAFTWTVFLVRFPAGGEVETPLPLPKNRYRKLARLSSRLAFLRLKPRGFETTEAALDLFGGGAVAIGAGGGGGTKGGGRSRRATLLLPNSVNQISRRPAGPAVIPSG